MSTKPVNLKNFQDRLSIAAHGITKDEAIAKAICVECRLDWRSSTKSEAGIREYAISGMCEECFDTLFKDE